MAPRITLGTVLILLGTLTLAAIAVLTLREFNTDTLSVISGFIFGLLVVVPMAFMIAVLTEMRGEQPRDQRQRTQRRKHTIEQPQPGDAMNTTNFNNFFNVYLQDSKDFVRFEQRQIQEPLFELRRLEGNRIYQFDLVNTPGDEVKYQCRDEDILIMKLPEQGWGMYKKEGCHLMSIPWNIVSHATSNRPPAGEWVEKSGSQAYVYELIYRDR